jgi:hypothetical protein
VLLGGILISDFRGSEGTMNFLEWVYKPELSHSTTPARGGMG